MKRLILAVLVVLAVLAAVPGIVSPSAYADSPTKYEAYETGDNASANVSADSWLAQTFTVGTVSHTISSVHLRLYKVGDPGTLTVSIRATDVSGHPTGGDLISTAISDSLITTVTTGAWMALDFISPERLSASTKYAVVIRAPAGDADNRVCVRYHDAGTYTDGNVEVSSGGGTTWNAESTHDAVFSVWGDPSLVIYDVEAYRRYNEAPDDDWLFVAHYNILWPPYSPDTSSKHCFNVQLIDATSVVLAQVKLPNWGRAVAGIWLSSEATAALDWGASYSIRIEGTGVCVTTTSVSCVVTWVGGNLNQLDSWVINTAGSIEEYYGIELTSFIGGKQVLNEVGTVVFDGPIPYLSSVRPHLFMWPSVDEPDEDFTGAYQATLDWENILGERNVEMLDDWGGLMGLSGRNIAQFGLLLGYAFFAGVLALGVPENKGPACLALVFPFIVMGGVTDLVPIAAIATIASITTLLLITALWFHRG